MSRVGQQPVPVGDNVKVDLKDGVFSATGPKGTLTLDLPPRVSVTLGQQQIEVQRDDDSKEARAMHGLARNLIRNLVVGVDTGYTRELEIRGVGFRAAVQGSTLVLNVGYSHAVNFPIPDGVEVKVTDNTKISVSGADKQQVGQVAASIRAVRKPEPYKGKGIRYVDEYVIQKEGKTA